MLQEPDLNNPHNVKQKKKKKKRRHSETEGVPEPLPSPAPKTQRTAAEPDGERKRKKKKKKRKREDEDGERVEDQARVPSHLDTSNQEEDWCQGGMWSLTPQASAEESKQKPQLSDTTPTQREERETDSVLKKKKKKKRENMGQSGEALQDTTSARSTQERCVEVNFLFVQSDFVCSSPALVLKYKFSLFIKLPNKSVCSLRKSID